MVMEAILVRLESLLDIYCGYTHLDCEFETENTRRLFQALNPEGPEGLQFRRDPHQLAGIFPGDPHSGIENTTY